MNNEDRPQAAPSKGTLPPNLQVSLSDQLYRQSKIDEENRRLKKKSKGDNGTTKKGKKTSKKSDIQTGDDNDEDLYPTIKVTRGGELPEGMTESGNEDNDNDQPVGKNKKHDPHRALNIDLDDKSIPIPPPPPPPPPVQIQKPPTTEKPKKIKKKKTNEKEEKSKPKLKRERSDYKELLSPVDEEEKRVVSPTPPSANTTTTEEKPKKKKTKEKKSTKTDNKTSEPLLFDMMSDDINPTNSSEQNYNEQNIYKLAAQSDYLTIVSIFLYSTSALISFLIYS